MKHYPKYLVYVEFHGSRTLPAPQQPHPRRLLRLRFARTGLSPESALRGPLLPHGHGPGIETGMALPRVVAEAAAAAAAIQEDVEDEFERS